MDDRFTPPRASLTPPEPTLWSSARAILFGGLVVGYLANVFLVLALGLLYPSLLDADLPMIWHESIFGLICAVLGGYVAGRRAGLAPLAHGAAAGLIILAMTVLQFAILAQGVEVSPPLVLSAILRVPLATLGGHLAGRAAVRRSPGAERG